MSDEVTRRRLLGGIGAVPMFLSGCSGDIQLLGKGPTTGSGKPSDETLHVPSGQVRTASPGETRYCAIEIEAEGELLFTPDGSVTLTEC